MDAQGGEVMRGREVPWPKVSEFQTRNQGGSTSQGPQGLSYISKVQKEAGTTSINVSRASNYVLLLVKTSSDVGPKLSGNFH